jgi:hypothetical protein
VKPGRESFRWRYAGGLLFAQTGPKSWHQLSFFGKPGMMSEQGLQPRKTSIVSIGG